MSTGLSRKQELYRRIIHDGITFIRNKQSACARPWYKTSPWESHLSGFESYLVAQMLHQIPLLMLEPTFTDADCAFLNGDVKTFFAAVEPETSFLYSRFHPPFRQLFNLMPAAERERLTWGGPALPEMTPERQKKANDFLLAAVERNDNIETLRNALVSGADLNIRDSQGRTALMMAVALGKDDYAVLLREAGAAE